MGQNTIEDIQGIINYIRGDDILNAAVFSEAGMHIMGELPKDVTKDIYELVANSIADSSKKIKEGMKGKLEQTVIEFKKIKIMVINVGKYILLLIVKKDADVNAVLESIKKPIEKLKEL